VLEALAECKELLMFYFMLVAVWHLLQLQVAVAVLSLQIVVMVLLEAEPLAVQVKAVTPVPTMLLV
jgi:hypothetical protein